MRPTLVRARLLAVLAALAAGCASTPDPGVDPDAVEREVRDALREFQAAQESLDPERVLAFLARDFHTIEDGARVGRDEIASRIAATFDALHRFETRFYDVEIDALGEDAALTSFAFRDSIAGADGASRRSGASTLLWHYDGERWSIVYAHSDHRAETQ